MGLYGSIASIFLRNATVVSIVATPVCTPPAVPEESPFHTSLPTFTVFYCINPGHSAWSRVKFQALPTLVFLVAEDGKHFLKCFLATCVSALESSLFAESFF